MATRPVGATTEIMVDPNNPLVAHIVEREFPLRAVAIGVAVIFAAFFVVFAAIAFL